MGSFNNLPVTNQNKGNQKWLDPTNWLQYLVFNQFLRTSKTLKHLNKKIEILTAGVVLKPCIKCHDLKKMITLYFFAELSDRFRVAPRNSMKNKTLFFHVRHTVFLVSVNLKSEASKVASEQIMPKGCLGVRGRSSGPRMFNFTAVRHSTVHFYANCLHFIFAFFFIQNTLYTAIWTQVD